MAWLIFYVIVPVVSQVTLDVVWDSFLSRQDPIWSWNATSPDPDAGRPREWVKGLYGGNSQLGYLLWQPNDSIIHISLSRSDLYDDRTAESTPAAFMGNFVYDRPRLPVGHYSITFSSPVVSAVGRMRLHTARSEYNVTLVDGMVYLSVWAAQQLDVIVLECSSTSLVDVQWVPELAQSTWSGRDSKYTPNPPPLNTSNLIVWGRLNTTVQPHLSGTAHATSQLWTPKSDDSGVVLFTSISPVLPSPGQAATAAESMVLAAAALGVQAVRKTHEHWWAAFWPSGGFLTMEDSVLEALFYVQVYKFACAARRGRAFMDLNGPWLVTPDMAPTESGTNAPDLHWDWNIQGMYYLPIVANRPEIAGSLVDYLEGLLHSGSLSSPSNVPMGWEDSAAAPAGASALDGLQSCYWVYGPNCTSAPPTVTGNLLWALQVATEVAFFSGNTTALTAVVFPLLDKALQFYYHFFIDSGGVVSLPPTFSPEYPGGAGPNANYDLALLRWGLSAALGLVARFNLSSPHAEAWNDTLHRLVPYSFDAPSNTYSVYEGRPYNSPHRHFSHLLMVWPLRGLLNLSDPTTFSRARDSVDLWSSLPELGSLFGRPTCASMNVLLRRPAAAVDNMSYLLETRLEGSGWYREPGGVGGEGGATSCNETPFMAAYTLVDWLLQSWNTTSTTNKNIPAAGGGSVLGAAAAHIIEPFPGLISSLNLTTASPYDSAPVRVASASFFNLSAIGGFTVSAHREGGYDGGGDLYSAKTIFVAVTAPRTTTPLAPPRCIVRLADMVRPLALTVFPGGGEWRATGNVSLVELNDGGLVEVLGLGPGDTVALYSNFTQPLPSFIISPKTGCPTQYNFWGGGVTPIQEAVSGFPHPPIHNSTTIQPPPHPSSSAPWQVVALCPCNSSRQLQQRFSYTQESGQLQLLDGTGRCLGLRGCSAAPGSAAVLMPCGKKSHPPQTIQRSAMPLPTPLGCRPSPTPRPPSNCDPSILSWNFTGVSGTPPFALVNKQGQTCLELHGGSDPDNIDVWNCQECLPPQCTVMNQQWELQGSFLVSLAHCCKGLCLTAV